VEIKSIRKETFETIEIVNKRGKISIYRRFTFYKWECFDDESWDNSYGTVTNRKAKELEKLYQAYKQELAKKHKVCTVIYNIKTT
jgi:Neuraminidase (sialidase)